MECFICCSKSDKTDQDKLIELCAKRKKFAYPVITLSDAYGCKCNSMHAHNKCLLNINKCPSCRKVVLKPNLYVRTQLDFYLYYLFAIIKSNPKIIECAKYFGTGLMILLITIYILIDKNIINVNDTNIKFHISIGILLFISLFVGFILALEDYFVKYWLYNKQTGFICCNVK